MKTPACLIAFGLAAWFSVHTSAQSLTKDLPPFDKVAVSPLIHLVLLKGEAEQVRIEYSDVSPDKIKYRVSGKKLRIYLDHAKLTVKNRRYWEDGCDYTEPIYGPAVQVTAYVTYKELRMIEKRGEETVDCNGPLTNNKLTVRLFGANEANLSSVQAHRLKASLFGENTLRIKEGQSQRQRFHSFGENTVDTRHVTGLVTSTSSFGDSRFRLHAASQIRVTTFGESDVRYAGGAQLTKRLVIGESSIDRLH